MSKYTVTAVDRSSIGHPNYHRGQRSWPSGQPVEVEVLDQNEDPMVTELNPRTKEMCTFPDPKRIGRLSWANIIADKKLTVQPVGATPDEARAQQAVIADLQDKLATTTARAEIAEKEITRLRAENAELVGEVSSLQVRLKEMESQLDEATRPVSQPSVPVNLDGKAKGKRG